MHNTMVKLYLYDLIETRKQIPGLSLSISFVDCNLNIKSKSNTGGGLIIVAEKTIKMFYS